MQLTVRNDKSEQFLYNCPKFPAYFGRGQTADFPNYTSLGHWHDDLEFALVLSGRMNYSINGEAVQVCSGEGIFINTRQVHYNFSQDHQNSEYICMLLHPMLLCASQYVEDTFVAPILNHPDFPYQLLRKGCPWEQDICRTVSEIYERQQEPESQLAVQAAFFRIWEALYRHAPIEKRSSSPGNQNLSILKKMVGYIQKHYQSKISLMDIAKAGNVSKTTCCNIFQKYVNQPPNAYLIEYRLRNGIELLCTTEMTVTEISYEVGFSGSSYFCESFRKAFGYSPAEYRKVFRTGAPGSPDEAVHCEPDANKKLLK